MLGLPFCLGLSLVAVRGLLTVTASPAVEQSLGLQYLEHVGAIVEIPGL